MEKIETTWKDVWNSLNTEYAEVIKKAIRESYTTDTQVFVILNTETLELSIECRPYDDRDTSFYTAGNLALVGVFNRMGFNTRTRWTSWSEILQGDMCDEVEEVNETLNALWELGIQLFNAELLPMNAVLQLKRMFEKGMPKGELE